MMTGFEEHSAREAQGGGHARSLRRSIMVAVMTFLAAIAVAVLAPASNHASPPSGRFVLACGNSPGPCLLSPGLPHRASDRNLDS